MTQNVNYSFPFPLPSPTHSYIEIAKNSLSIRNSINTSVDPSYCTILCYTSELMFILSVQLHARVRTSTGTVGVPNASNKCRLYRAHHFISACICTSCICLLHRSDTPMVPLLVLTCCIICTDGVSLPSTSPNSYPTCTCGAPIGNCTVYIIIG